jgi:hypothetical protein
MSLTNNLDSKKIAPIILRQAAIWFPVAIGVLHQFLMFIDYSDRIYVFVDPPGYIEPFVTLEFQWWVVLLVGSATAAVLAYSRYLPTVPNRIALPFYLYALFLLILVKPI